jgi:spore germination cell wall hydrolase CwlJ-like protein
MSLRRAILTSVLVLALNKPSANTNWISAKEFTCLTDNIYYEARGESFLGQIAVGRVTLNRAELFSKSVCSIVYEPSQFSWTLKPHRVNDKEAYRVAKEAAIASKEYYQLPVYYFHNIHIKPKWSYKYKPVMTIDNHIFYSNELK